MSERKMTLEVKGRNTDIMISLHRSKKHPSSPAPYSPTGRGCSCPVGLGQLMIQALRPYSPPVFCEEIPLTNPKKRHRICISEATKTFIVVLSAAHGSALHFLIDLVGDSRQQSGMIRGYGATKWGKSAISRGIYHPS